MAWKGLALKTLVPGAVLALAIAGLSGPRSSAEEARAIPAPALDEPATSNAVPAPPGWVILPADAAVPSPQRIVAVKSPVVAVGLASVKLPTPIPLSAMPVLPDCDTVAPAVSAASAMTAKLAPETVIGRLLWVTETTTW